MSIIRSLMAAALFLLSFCTATVLHSQSCSGNLLQNASGYYGGFEAGNLNFSAATGMTDLTYGSHHGSYQVVGEHTKPWGGTGYVSLQPHSGAYMMLIHNDESRLWYKTVQVFPGQQFQFSAWLASAKQHPVVGFEVRLQVKYGNVTTVISTATAPQGAWSQISANFTVPAGVNTIEIQLVDPFPNGQLSNYLAIDDMCLKLSVSESTLPVSLISFAGKKEESTVRLNWETAAESNSSHFVVEHSTDGVKWKTIGSVGAAGNSNSRRSYTFRHATPINGSNYYRLQQIDLDGKSATSSVIIIRTGARVTIGHLYPNPFAESFQLAISSESATKATVQIFDVSGRMLQKAEKLIAAGGNTVTVDELESLKSGTYFIKVSVGDVTVTEKLSKK